MGDISTAPNFSGSNALELGSKLDIVLVIVAFVCISVLCHGLLGTQLFLLYLLRGCLSVFHEHTSDHWNQFCNELDLVLQMESQKHHIK